MGKAALPGRSWCAHCLPAAAFLWRTARAAVYPDRFLASHGKSVAGCNSVRWQRLPELLWQFAELPGTQPARPNLEHALGAPFLGGLWFPVAQRHKLSLAPDPALLQFCIWRGLPAL